MIFRHFQGTLYNFVVIMDHEGLVCYIGVWDLAKNTEGKGFKFANQTNLKMLKYKRAYQNEGSHLIKINSTNLMK